MTNKTPENISFTAEVIIEILKDKPDLRMLWISAYLHGEIDFKHIVGNIGFNTKLGMLSMYLSYELAKYISHEKPEEIIREVINDKENSRMQKHFPEWDSYAENWGFTSDVSKWILKFDNVIPFLIEYFGSDSLLLVNQVKDLIETYEKLEELEKSL